MLVIKIISMLLLLIGIDWNADFEWTSQWTCMNLHELVWMPMNKINLSHRVCDVSMGKSIP